MRSRIRGQQVAPACGGAGEFAAHESAADDPKLGDPKKRGILMEAVTAMMLLLAGANILIMRHPEAIKLVKEMIGITFRDRFL